MHELSVCLALMQQVERIATHADGVIVGSALVEQLEQGHDPTAFLEALIND